MNNLLMNEKKRNIKNLNYGQQKMLSGVLFLTFHDLSRIKESLEFLCRFLLKILRRKKIIVN